MNGSRIAGTSSASVRLKTAVLTHQVRKASGACAARRQSRRAANIAATPLQAPSKVRIEVYEEAGGDRRRVIAYTMTVAAPRPPRMRAMSVIPAGLRSFTSRRLTGLLLQPVNHNAPGSYGAESRLKCLSAEGRRMTRRLGGIGCVVGRGLRGRELSVRLRGVLRDPHPMVSR